MDHSFNDRVDKVFGSISSSLSTSTPWSLTDAQVERRVWNRDKADNKDDDDETLVSSSFDNLFNGRRNRRKRLDDISDDDEDIGGDGGVQTENDGDEWDIRSSIGLDSTLDNEEEEDAYDKMAEGRENGGERLYMRDVTHHGPYLNSYNVLPHANHDAAKARLKEEEEEDGDEPMLNVEEASEENGYGIRIKSILKRKNDNDDDVVKPAKRVRFDPNCKNEDELRNSIQQSQGNGRSVPDYVVNPSKYTRYDLEFTDQIKKSEDFGVEEKSTATATTVVFIPRKKRGDAAASNRACEDQLKQPSAKPIPIAAVLEEQQQQGEISQEIQEVSSKKPDRRYRPRMEQDDTCS